MSLSVLSLTGDEQIAIVGVLIGGLFLVAVYAGAMRALIYFVRDRVRQPQREAEFLRYQVNSARCEFYANCSTACWRGECNCPNKAGRPPEGVCYLRDEPGYCDCHDPSRRCDRLMLSDRQR